MNLIIFSHGKKNTLVVFFGVYVVFVFLLSSLQCRCVCCKKAKQPSGRQAMLFFRAVFSGGSLPAAQWMTNELLQEACGYSFVAWFKLR